jgi:hypothetical protein
MARAPLAPEALLEQTREVLPLLAENAARTEELRRVAPENMEALTDAGVFRMTVGRAFGGFQTDLLTQYEVLSAVSSACPSTGWVATILTAMIWNIGMFPDEAQDEVFADPRVRIASVFSPRGKAVREQGGVVVSGSWPFNTGCHYAQWAILTALVDEGEGDPVPTSLLILRRPDDPGRLERDRDGGNGKQHDRRRERLRPRAPDAADRAADLPRPADRSKRRQRVLPQARRLVADRAGRRHPPSAPPAAPSRRSCRGCPGGGSPTRPTQISRWHP